MENGMNASITSNFAENILSRNIVTLISKITEIYLEDALEKPL